MKAGTAFFGQSFMSSSAAANAFDKLAGAGFTLFIPILAGFIAQSIVGRHAMAPAMILALVFNDGSGATTFN